MHSGKLMKTMASIALVLVLGVPGLSAQNAASGTSLDAASVVKEMNLPKDKAEDALKVVNGFVASVQDSSRQFAALLQQKAGDLLDPQFQAKSDQIRKGLAVRIERFSLDLADIAGEAVADAVVARYTAVIPSVLLSVPPVAVSRAEPAVQTPGTRPVPVAPAPAAKKPPEVPLGSTMPSMPGMTGAPAGKVPEVALGTDPSLDLSIQGGSSSASGGMGMMDMMGGMMDMMGGMGGMSGSSSMAPDPVITQLTAQLNSINSLIDQMIKRMSAPGGATESHLQVLNQLLANQRSLIELLATKAGSASSGSMAPMGMM